MICMKKVLDYVGLCLELFLSSLFFVSLLSIKYYFVSYN